MVIFLVCSVIALQPDLPTAQTHPPQVNRNSVFAFGKEFAMPKTTTCFGYYSKEAKQEVVFPIEKIPATRWESFLLERHGILFATSCKSLMVAPMSVRLWRSLISKSATAPFSFAHAAESPSATQVCARPRSRRLRYGF